MQTPVTDLSLGTESGKAYDVQSAGAEDNPEPVGSPVSPATGPNTRVPSNPMPIHVINVHYHARMPFVDYSLLKQARSTAVVSPNEPDPASPGVIHGTMSLSDIIACLKDHGCQGVTDQLDDPRSSKFPFATGGFGDVYSGLLRDGSQVSLKCMRLMIGSNDDGRKQLKRAAHELYVWSKCRHPNVLELIGVAEFRNQLAMVSPWMKRGNLGWYLSQNPEAESYGLCLQVAEGVAYLHGEGIIHGDIKAANILVSEDGCLKLTDFGNAVLREYTLKFTTTTKTPSVSMRWTAPEVVLGEEGISYQADIYALGMTFLEVITREVPYKELGDVAVYAKIIRNIHPVRPRGVLPPNNTQADSLWSLLISCWSSHAENRPVALGVRDRIKLIMAASLATDKIMTTPSHPESLESRPARKGSYEIAPRTSPIDTEAQNGTPPKRGTSPEPSRRPNSSSKLSPSPRQYLTYLPSLPWTTSIEPTPRLGGHILPLHLPSNNTSSEPPKWPDSSSELPLIPRRPPTPSPPRTLFTSLIGKDIFPPEIPPNGALSLVNDWHVRFTDGKVIEWQIQEETRDHGLIWTVVPIILNEPHPQYQGKGFNIRMSKEDSALKIIKSGHCGALGPSHTDFSQIFLGI